MNVLTMEESLAAPHGRIILVHAEIWFGHAVSCIHRDDWGVPGIYVVSVPRTLDDETAAACALGVFHWTVPVQRPRTFEFVTLTEDGEELAPRVDVSWYELVEQYWANCWLAM